MRLFLLLFLSSLVTACGLNGSHAAAFPEPELYRLQPGELILAAAEEDIPPIQADDTNFVPAEKADLDDLDLVVGLLIGVEARAYPVRLLSLHEVVNDQVGGYKITVTWCPLCYSAVVYNRFVEGQELSFRASGYLLHDNLVLVDHPTDTLWSQLLGQGIKGALKGSVLGVIPSTITRWGIWRDTYPETKVLSATSLGYDAVLPDPYGGYYSSAAPGLGSDGEIDPRLPAKSLVIGVVSGEFVKAYPLDSIREEKIILDTLGDRTISIVWDEDLLTGQVFWGDISGQLSKNANPDPASLVQLPSQLVYWFAWTGFYPGSNIYQSR